MERKPSPNILFLRLNHFCRAKQKDRISKMSIFPGNLEKLSLLKFAITLDKIIFLDFFVSNDFVYDFSVFPSKK